MSPELTVQHPLQPDEARDKAAANGQAKGIINEISGSHSLKRKLLIFLFNLFPLSLD